MPAILAKGIDRGLLDSGKSYTDDEIVKLIFLSGFSTKTVTSHISGRGVGLDAVRSFSQLAGVDFSLELLPSNDRQRIPFRFVLVIPADLYSAMNADDINTEAHPQDLKSAS